MGVVDTVRSRSGDLTAAERRLAEVLINEPQAVGFGTVVQFAAAAGTGSATVVRFATKLGYDGFTGLQAAVQAELVTQLRPAAERIREQAGEGIVERHAAVELGNVRATLDAVDTTVLTKVADRLADTRKPIMVISGEESASVADHLAAQLDRLRPGVTVVRGNDVAVHRELALAERRTALIAIDIRRYDQWLLRSLDVARDRKLWVVAVTDSLLAPLARGARATFVVSAGAVGPFDSHVGTLALCELLVTEVAERLREPAIERLDAVERAWRAGTSLTEG